MKTSIILIGLVMLLVGTLCAVETEKIDDATMNGIKKFLDSQVADSVYEIYGEKALSLDGVSYYFAQITLKGEFIAKWVVICQDDHDQNFDDEFSEFESEFEMNPVEKTAAQMHLISQTLPFKLIPNSRESFQKNYAGWFVMEVDKTS